MILKALVIAGVEYSTVPAEGADYAPNQTVKMSLSVRDGNAGAFLDDLRRHDSIIILTGEQKQAFERQLELLDAMIRTP